MKTLTIDKRTSRLKSTWRSMMRRCTYPKHPAFAHYGGRGITVCERWLVFANFFADMGHKPTSKHSLDRIDNNGDYEPGNCRWATRREQANNTRGNRSVTIAGITLTVPQWSRKLKRDPAVIHARLRAGWNPADAVILKSGSKSWGSLTPSARTKAYIEKHLTTGRGS